MIYSTDKQNNSPLPYSLLSSRHLSLPSNKTMDKELGAARKARWNKAFNESAIEEPAQVAIYRKATIIIEVWLHEPLYEPPLVRLLT